MPRKEELPESLHPLLYKNAVSIRHGKDFKPDVLRLVEGLHKAAEWYHQLAASFGGLPPPLLEERTPIARFHTACPGCHNRFSFKAEQAGKLANCKRCQSRMVLPNGDGIAAIPIRPLVRQVSSKRVIDDVPVLPGVAFDRVSQSFGQSVRNSKPRDVRRPRLMTIALAFWILMSCIYAIPSIGLVCLLAIDLAELLMCRKFDSFVLLRVVAFASVASCSLYGFCCWRWCRRLDVQSTRRLGLFGISVLLAIVGLFGVTGALFGMERYPTQWQEEFRLWLIGALVMTSGHFVACLVAIIADNNYRRWRCAIEASPDRTMKALIDSWQGVI